MARRVVSGTVMAIAALLIGLSLASLTALWVFHGSLTRQALEGLAALDGELAQAEIALAGADVEIRRAVRILDGAEKALESLSRTTANAQETLQGLGAALDERVIPGLRGAGEQLDQVAGALQGVLDTLEAVNDSGLFPVVIPGESWLTGLIAAAEQLNGEIGNIEALAQGASTFLADVGYVLGGDFDETRQGLERLQETVSVYRARLAAWRAAVANTAAGLAGDLDRVSVFLSLALLWFGVSQLSVFLHAWQTYRGSDPLAVLRVEGSAPAV